MRLARRHTALLTLFIPLVSAADCLGGDPDPEEERKACEDVCKVEADCELRTEDACLEALCADDGFKVIKDGEDEVDLAKVAANDCMREAANCADAALCICPDGCGRVADCTGSEDPTCEGNCETLMEQTPTETYTENRCQLESTCADLPACAVVN